MFRLGVIEESLKNPDALEMLKPFFFSQRTQEISGDPYPVWHTNEYHVENDALTKLLPLLERQVKKTWYIHAFNEKELIVVLPGKSFRISPRRDKTWDDMIAYGEAADVERHYLEGIELNV